MESNLTKYFASELASDEKEDFLKEVDNNGELREEFLEYQNLVALVDWTYPMNDEELAHQKLSEFMRRMETRDNKID